MDSTGMEQGIAVLPLVTTGQLAQECHTSRSTIIRLALRHGIQAAHEDLNQRLFDQRSADRLRRLAAQRPRRRLRRAAGGSLKTP